MSTYTTMNVQLFPYLPNKSFMNISAKGSSCCKVLMLMKAGKLVWAGAKGVFLLLSTVADAGC